MQPRNLVLRLIMQSGIWLLIMAAMLFLGAGRMDWPQGWAFLLLFAVLSAVFGAVAIRRNPRLLEARLAGLNQPGQPLWDKVFTGFFLLAWLAWLVLMGANAGRWHPSQMPPVLNVLGGVIIVLGFGVTARVLLENSFAAPVVRVQTERGQHVIDTGPYALVRHPMYATALLFLTGMPLLLGSWTGFIGVGLIFLGLALRSVAEENLLRRELPGYAAYMQKVRYRLIPYIW
jgi:protein-S-isoprenylcysteine O-methyltransferase Ste14